MNQDSQPFPEDSIASALEIARKALNEIQWSRESRYVLKDIAKTAMRRIGGEKKPSA